MEPRDSLPSAAHRVMYRHRRYERRYLGRPDPCEGERRLAWLSLGWPDVVACWGYRIVYAARQFLPSLYRHIQFGGLRRALKGPARQLLDSPQPIANGVGMHGETVTGRVDRGVGFKVRDQGRDQGIAIVGWLVEKCAEDLAAQPAGAGGRAQDDHRQWSVIELGDPRGAGFRIGHRDSGETQRVRCVVQTCIHRTHTYCPSCSRVQNGHQPSEVLLISHGHNADVHIRCQPPC